VALVSDAGIIPDIATPAYRTQSPSASAIPREGHSRCGRGGVLSALVSPWLCPPDSFRNSYNGSCRTQRRATLHARRGRPGSPRTQHFLQAARILVALEDGRHCGRAPVSQRRVVIAREVNKMPQKSSCADFGVAKCSKEMRNRDGGVKGEHHDAYRTRRNRKNCRMQPRTFEQAKKRMLCIA